MRCVEGASQDRLSVYLGEHLRSPTFSSSSYDYSIFDYNWSFKTGTHRAWDDSIHRSYEPQARWLPVMSVREIM